jgi:N,N'-diacetyllegionaminate synthase
MVKEKNTLFGKNLLNGSDGDACIIAEVGVNHDGSFNKAKKLIDIAAEAKCTCVKFQTFKTEAHMSVNSIASSYITHGSKKGESFYKLAKRLELSYDEQRELFSYAQRIGIPWISSFFDEESLEFLVDLGVSVLKVASGEITNFPLLGKAVKKKIPMIISTGMASMEEIDEVFSFLRSYKAKEIYLMHCVSWYPAKIDDMNIKVIDTLFNKFNVPIGLSDHTLGINVAIGARARGVKLFEKHFTLSKKDFGPDHGASIEPDELKQFVVGIDEAGRSLGTGLKVINKIEMCQRRVHRKSIVAIKKIKAGSIIKEEMLSVKRPGFGIQPKYFNKLLGYKMLKDVEEDEVITWNMISKVND